MQRSAGAEGNEKLTAMTGVVLLVGFAVEGVTIVALHKLLVLHFVVGALLVGPVLLKIASTSYRFARYYTGSRPYVRKGPPAPVLRVLGPFVILTSVAVIATGLTLAVVGHNSEWLFLHKASFVLWFGVMTVHVVWYAPQLPRILLGWRYGADSWLASAYRTGGYRPGTDPEAAAGPVPGAWTRWLVLLLSLAVGVAVAAVTMQLSGKWGISL